MAESRFLKRSRRDLSRSPARHLHRERNHLLSRSATRARFYHYARPLDRSIDRSIGSVRWRETNGECFPSKTRNPSTKRCHAPSAPLSLSLSLCSRSHTAASSSFILWKSPRAALERGFLSFINRLPPSSGACRVKSSDYDSRERNRGMVARINLSQLVSQRETGSASRILTRSVNGRKQKMERREGERERERAREFRGSVNADRALVAFRGHSLNASNATGTPDIVKGGGRVCRSHLDRARARSRR